MKRWVFFLMLTLSWGYADEELLTLDSAQATYQDQTITLSGRVVLEHSLGQVQAEKMTLKVEDQERKMTPVSLEMEDQVSLKFKEGGVLTCDQAFFDYKEMFGVFQALEGNSVEYLEVTSDSQGREIPLSVQSQKMEAKIEKNSISGKNVIHEVKAFDQVVLNYNHQYHAKGDIASYYRFQNPLSSIAGTLILESKEPQALCELTFHEHNLIRSPRIEINTETRHLKFLTPAGSLFFGESMPLEFSAETLVWDDQKHLLSLKDKVFINQQGLGNISNEDEIQIHLHEKDGKQTIRLIDSFGETRLNYIDNHKQLVHALVAFGKVLVNHENLRTTLESPRNEQGEVLPGKQIHFSDHYGEIFADQATLFYEKNEKDAQLKKIILKGHVKILNRTSLNLSDEGEFLQYVLAEAVEFLPESKEMTFIGTKKNRVLFMDEVNSVQISAPALKMIRDPRSQKDSIKGTGDVRFSFLEKELELIKKRFELNKKESKDDT